MMLPVCGLGKGRKASLLIFIAQTHVQFHLSDEQHWECVTIRPTYLNVWQHQKEEEKPHSHRSHHSYVMA